MIKFVVYRMSITCPPTKWQYRDIYVSLHYEVLVLSYLTLDRLFSAAIFCASHFIKKKNITRLYFTEHKSCYHLMNVLFIILSPCHDSWVRMNINASPQILTCHPLFICQAYEKSPRKHIETITLLTCPWASPSCSPSSWSTFTLEIVIFEFIMMTEGWQSCLTFWKCWTPPSKLKQIQLAKINHTN